jgi:hypothetical protein
MLFSTEKTTWNWELHILGLMVISVTKGGTWKLPQHFKIVEIYC